MKNEREMFRSYVPWNNVDSLLLAAVVAGIFILIAFFLVTTVSPLATKSRACDAQPD